MFIIYCCSLFFFAFVPFNFLFFLVDVLAALPNCCWQNAFLHLQQRTNRPKRKYSNTLKHAIIRNTNNHFCLPVTSCFNLHTSIQENCRLKIIITIDKYVQCMDLIENRFLAEIRMLMKLYRIDFKRFSCVNFAAINIDKNLAEQLITISNWIVKMVMCRFHGMRKYFERAAFRRHPLVNVGFLQQLEATYSHGIPRE